MREIECFTVTIDKSAIDFIDNSYAEGKKKKVNRLEEKKQSKVTSIQNTRQIEYLTMTIA